MALAKVFAAAAGVVLLAACSGGDAKPTTTAPPTAATSPTPAETPATPEPTATAQPAGIDWSHNLAVYTVITWVEQAPGGLEILSLVAWDLEANRLAASFEFGGKEGFPRGAELAGRDVVTFTESQVMHSHLDGTSRRVLLAAAEGTSVQDIAIAPDASRIAVVTSPLNVLEPGELRILDISSGGEVLVVQQADPQFAEMRGHFGFVQWRADGTGVLVGTATHSEAHDSLATVFLDGRVRIEPTPGYGSISPTGRLRAGLVGNVECMFVASHEFAIWDLDAGTMPVTTRDEAVLFTPWEWSPDGKEFVFKRQQATGCEDLSVEKQENWLVRSPDGVSSFGAPQPVPDLEAVHRRWYGDALFTLDCPPSGEPVVDRWGDSWARCRDSAPKASTRVFVGGRPAGEGSVLEFVGVLRP